MAPQQATPSTPAPRYALRGVFPALLLFCAADCTERGEQRLERGGRQHGLRREQRKPGCVGVRRLALSAPCCRSCHAGEDAGRRCHHSVGITGDLFATVCRRSRPQKLTYIEQQKKYRARAQEVFDKQAGGAQFSRSMHSVDSRHSMHSGRSMRPARSLAPGHAVARQPPQAGSEAESGATDGPSRLYHYIFWGDGGPSAP